MSGEHKIHEAYAAAEPVKPGKALAALETLYPVIHVQGSAQKVIAFATTAKQQAAIVRSLNAELAMMAALEEAELRLQTAHMKADDEIEAGRYKATLEATRNAIAASRGWT